MPFEWLVAVVALLAGGVASISGFGIGSLLTPLLASQQGMKTAVAAVALPHVVATLVRFWKLRGDVDRRLLPGFGGMNAAGSLAGALLHVYVSSPLLSVVLGALLVFTGIVGLAGYASKMRFRGKASWLAGLVSGGFGGLVGNQGGLRSAAMLGLGLHQRAFVATATAIGLAVDGVRMPVYFATQSAEMLAVWASVVAATIGVVIGTLAGERVLRWIPEKIFHRVVSAVLFAVGVLLLIR